MLRQYHCSVRAYISDYCRSYVFYWKKKEIFHIVNSTLVYIFFFFIDQVHPYLTSPSALSNAQNGAEVFFVMHAAEFFCCCPAVQSTPVRNSSGGRGVNNAFSSCLTHSLTSIISTTVLKSPTVLTYA